MKITRSLVLAAVAAATLVAVSGCDMSTSGQKAENQQQSSMQQQIQQNQPLPNITHSQLRANLAEVEQAEAKGAATTTFFFNQGVQDPIRSCPSIGMPIPITDSLSNPQQIQWSSNGGAGVTGQMDPNGVYTGADSSGTYVMCVDGNGKPIATYWEGFVEAEFGPAVWDQAAHQVKLTGPSTFTFTAPQK